MPMVLQGTGKGQATVNVVSVGTSPTLLVAANERRSEVNMFNNGTQTIYVGDENVTPETGWPVLSGTPFGDSITTAAWYGVVAATSADMAVIETVG